MTDGLTALVQQLNGISSDIQADIEILDEWASSWHERNVREAAKDVNAAARTLERYLNELKAVEAALAALVAPQPETEKDWRMETLIAQQVDPAEAAALIEGLKDVAAGRVRSLDSIDAELGVESPARVSPAPEPATVNLNDDVYVRVTAKGIAALDESDAQWSKIIGFSYARAATVRKEQAETGWSRWQLWALIEAFGPMMYLGCDPPIETTIRLQPPSSGVVPLPPGGETRTRTT